MERFQNPLFLSPARGRRNKQIPLFAREIRGCVRTQPARRSAASPPRHPVRPRTGPQAGRTLRAGWTLRAERRARAGRLPHRWRRGRAGNSQKRDPVQGSRGSHETKPRTTSVKGPGLDAGGAQEQGKGCVRAQTFTETLSSGTGRGAFLLHSGKPTRVESVILLQTGTNETD